MPMILDRTGTISFKDWIAGANAEGGIIPVDKDSGWTSFDVVAKLRNLTRIRKTGHAGTLDPLATGLLILCFGKATKKIESIQQAPKSYSAVIRLGAKTATCDAEAPEEDIVSLPDYTTEQIKTAANKYIGKILQVPPIFSAKKIGGKRLYQIARKNPGIELEIKPSEVEIYRIGVKEVNLPFVSIDVECSKGTYIRSLARDIGDSLGVGGYLAELRRTAIGDFRVENALKVGELIEMAKEAEMMSEVSNPFTNEEK